MKLKTFFLSLTCLGLFLFSSLIASAGTFNNLMFSDVAKDSKNFDAIYFLYNTGVIEGYDQEESKLRDYKPQNKINRAEFLKLILEGTDKATNTSYKSCFPDVSGKEWYATYVCQAKEQGIVNGYPDGTFRPEQTINEAESLKILGKLLGWMLPTASKNDPWYKPYSDFADKKEIMPVEDISSYMTRGDIAEMIFRNTQVESMDVPEFNPELVDELFYQNDVPYGGPLGPGGLFGPGGFFGAAGAFYDGGYFVDEEGKFELLGEDYYQNRYCYYSDDGDFREDVYDTLDLITNGKIDEVELAGYNVDDFGVMFCYTGIAETNLQLFTKQLREENDVECWFDPLSLSSANKSSEKLFCYAKPKKPDWVEESTYCKEEFDDLGNRCISCYEDVFAETVISKTCEQVSNAPIILPKDLGEGKDLYIEINGAEGFTAGDDGANLEFFITDNNGAPVIKRNLKLFATTGIDYFKEFKVEEAGMGVYKANFSTTLAGLYILNVIDESGKKNDVALRVNPGSFDHVQMVDTMQPWQGLDPSKASVRIASKDKYDNTIPYSTVDNNLKAITTLGTVEVSQYNDIFNLDVSVDDWGTAELSVMYNGNIIDNTIKFDFFPIQIDMPKGISVDEKQVEAPVYIYFPKKYGTIGSYDFKIKYNSKGLQLDDFVDFDSTDKVLMPYYEIKNGYIHIWQPLNLANAKNTEILPIGTMLFNVTAVGDGTIQVADAVIKDTEGASRFTSEPVGELGGAGLWTGTHVVKPTKNICIEAFVLPGGGAVEADVESDVNQANEIFKAISRSCNCNFYLNISLKKPITTITQAQMDVFDVPVAGVRNGIIESDGNLADGHADEIDNMMANHPASPGCIASYYTPQIDLGGASMMGVNYSSAASNGVVVNNNLDHDGRTLAHELAHQFSHGDVGDPTGADAHAEGADQAGNLMNYTNTGDNLTPHQCSEIEARLP